jgi:dCTP deaminase
LTVLSDRDIRAALERGEMDLEPFDERRLTPNGYDLGIAQVAVPDRGTAVAEGTARVPPGARFAVSTQERVRLGPGLAGQLWLRTTWARRGVLASFGRVDAGFDGQLTLAALNASAGELEVPIGQTFAQLVIEPLTSAAAVTYEGRSGHYQHQRGVTLAPASGAPKGGRREGGGGGGSARSSRGGGVAAPCLERGCHACCERTEMPLSERDVARLRALGHDPGAFSARGDGDQVTLANVDGRCHFLGEDDRCRVYGDRPEGCALYPLILDEETGAVVVDPLCPQGDGVTSSRRDADALRTLLVRLERERLARSRGKRGGG